MLRQLDLFEDHSSGLIIFPHRHQPAFFRRLAVEILKRRTNRQRAALWNRQLEHAVGMAATWGLSREELDEYARTYALALNGAIRREQTLERLHGGGSRAG